LDAGRGYFNPDELCALVPINVMGILCDIRYNSALVFQPVSSVMEPQAINQVRSILEGARGLGEGFVVVRSVTFDPSFVALQGGCEMGG